MHRLWYRIKRFIRADKGVAAVEFAMILPVLLALYIGVSEAGTLLITDRKVQSVAGAVGDLVARSNKTLTASQMEDYFRISTSIMSPYSTSRLTQTVTAIAVSATGEAVVSWSYEFTDTNHMVTGTRYRGGSEYDLPAEMIAIARGHTVIAAETNYTHRPLLGLFFDQSIDLHRSNFFLPRFGGTITIN